MTAAIRPFRERDVDALERCIAEMQEAERAIDARLRPGAAMARAYGEQLRARCAAPRGAILVAEVDGEVVGFVAVQTRVPYEGLDDPPGEYALVSDLVVLSDYRRRGMGRSLLGAAESHARAHGAPELQIEVLAANAVARGLYWQLGFRSRTELLSKPLHYSEASFATLRQ